MTGTIQKRASADAPFVAAAHGRAPATCPIWIMRQAGRYLPEYREVREKLSFLELCGTPEAAAEVTLQPIRRYDLDAAILFTDLLVPLLPMGLDVDYQPGPVLAKTVQTLQDVEALRVPQPQADLAPMLDTARLVREQLPDHKAVIGFVGAPFTMACYMIEGRGSKSWDLVRRTMHESPKFFAALLQRIEDCLKPLVHALVDAGCDAVQVFDSWASVLSTEDYASRCAPHTEALLRAIREKDAVAINYVNGASQHLETMSQSSAQVLGVDWRLSMTDVRSRVPDTFTLQGNLDPTALFLEDDLLRLKVREICASAGDLGHVFNLGHGILPQTDPHKVQVMVDEVRKSL